MASNNNIFCVSNPSCILDGLWKIMCESGVDLSDMLIFVPSHRAVRSIEKMIVKKIGHAVVLPKIVPLGSGVEDTDYELDEDSTVSQLERVIVMSYILSGLNSIKNMSTAIPVARTLVTMQDYLENSDIDISDVNWNDLVDERYAKHFQDKSEILSVIGRVNNEVFNGRDTETKRRNSAVYEWCNYVKNMDAEKSLIIVCGSTASVPVTRKLMTVIAGLQNGRIILPGKIFTDVEDFKLDTNPYNSEYKFLCDVGIKPSDVHEIDVGKSHIDFMNLAFSNTLRNNSKYDLNNCHLVTANRESEEAASVAEIADRAVKNGKSVLVITPDAAGNQRLMPEFERRGIDADFSGGMPGTMTPAGRALLNILDDWIEAGTNDFENLYVKCKFDLFDTISEIIEKYYDNLSPVFFIDDSVSCQVWWQIKKLSDLLKYQNIRVNLMDARAFVADSLSCMRIRGVMNDVAPVVVLGTIESRMQTADVVILMGLNEGMFPAKGYENPWLPCAVSEKIGLPSPNHKVSLMALDFMNLSCAPEVYWVRSSISGGVQTQESRFLSRIMVAHGDYDTCVADDVLAAVRGKDDVPENPLSYEDPLPPVDWSDVYVTSLELLIHNPYAFYVRHILKLQPEKDYWVGVDARDFGNLVHDVLEHAHIGYTAENLVHEMDMRACELLGNNNLLFHLWHRRFTEIAPVAVEILKQTPDAVTEVEGCIKIAGRTVRARADRIWHDGVIDIKTGAAPSRNQIKEGNMPQLPLEALMLKNGGFAMYRTNPCQTPVMKFLQLRAHDARIIEYNDAETAEAIRTAHDNIENLFNMYGSGTVAYKYLPTSDQKYKAYDDFARADERD